MNFEKMQAYFPIFYWMVLNLQYFFYKKSRHWCEDKIFFPPNACREAPLKSFELPKHAVMSWWNIFPPNAGREAFGEKILLPK